MYIKPILYIHTGTVNDDIIDTSDCRKEMCKSAARPFTSFSIEMRRSLTGCYQGNGAAIRWHTAGKCFTVVCGLGMKRVVRRWWWIKRYNLWFKSSMFHKKAIWQKCSKTWRRDLITSKSIWRNSLRIFDRWESSSAISSPAARRDLTKNCKY